MTRHILSRDEISRHLLNARQVAAIATAFFLPISTSGQAIAVGILALLCLLTLDRAWIVDNLQRPAAYLPVLLVALLVLGVSWSMLPTGAAFKWVGPYAKLLLIPLLLTSRFTPAQAIQIGIGFIGGCAILLALSMASLAWPSGPWGWFKEPGIPVKDNAVQSECFALCAFGLALGASYVLKQGETRRAIAMALLAVLFFADIFLIYISKTGVLTTAALLGLLLLHIGGWRRAMMIAVPALVVMAVALWTSAPAQRRLAEISIDMKAGNGVSETVSTASRLDFWSKAATFVKAAPIFGHGTGSIRPLYQAAEAERPSPYGEAVADPHNQILHIVLQIGLIGGLVLLAMWAAHLRLFLGGFLGRDFASAIGLAVVVQNIVGSMFNSHLSQVTQGMLYCVAVGILGGLVRTARHSSRMDQR